MTKRLEDLIADFTTISFEEQMERVKRARSARTIERPVAAAKRVKKESKKKAKNIDAGKQLVMSLTPAQRAELIAKLQGNKT